MEQEFKTQVVILFLFNYKAHALSSVWGCLSEISPLLVKEIATKENRGGPPRVKSLLFLNRCCLRESAIDPPQLCKQMNRRSSHSSSGLQMVGENVGHCFPLRSHLHKVLSLEGNRLELLHAIFQRLLDVERIWLSALRMIKLFTSHVTCQKMPNDKLLNSLTCPDPTCNPKMAVWLVLLKWAGRNRFQQSF